MQDVVVHFRCTRPLPADIDLLSEAVMILLAGRESQRLRRRAPFFMDELPVDTPGFDGDLFTAEYCSRRI